VGFRLIFAILKNHPDHFARLRSRIFFSANQERTVERRPDQLFFLIKGRKERVLSQQRATVVRVSQLSHHRATYITPFVLMRSVKGQVKQVTMHGYVLFFHVWCAGGCLRWDPLKMLTSQRIYAVYPEKISCSLCKRNMRSSKCGLFFLRKSKPFYWCDICWQFWQFLLKLDFNTCENHSHHQTFTCC